MIRRLLAASPVPLLTLSACATVPPPRERLEVAITMDDLPVHGALAPGETRLSVARRILDSFRQAGVPEVYGFVNGTYVEADPGTERVLAAWREAGYPLANHTWSHPSLDDLTAEQFEAEIARNEPLLERLAGGTDWRWFRYPFLIEGQDPAKRAAVRSALARGGYRIAQVTMSYGDYEYNDAYARCAARGDRAGMAELEASFLKSVQSSIDQARALSKAVHGRDIPYVLLTHVSPMNARMMPHVLELYRRAGFRFVPLARAEADPAYRTDIDPSLAPEPGLEARPRSGPVPPRYDAAPLLARVCR